MGIDVNLYQNQPIFAELGIVIFRFCYIYVRKMQYLATWSINTQNESSSAESGIILS